MIRPNRPSENLSDIHATLLRIERLLCLMVPAEKIEAMGQAKWELGIRQFGLTPSDFAAPTLVLGAKPDER